MEGVKLQNIARTLLKVDDAKISYFSESELNRFDISVEVEDVGSIELPLTKNCIEKLIGISSQAKFGWREHTILDEEVRNTHEIVAEKLKVNIIQSSLTHLLENVKEGLGLDKVSDLKPHLHNMLIYSPGNFFVMHQDMEKQGNMIATLVVVLPSAHIGGDLVIHQGDEKHVFSTENTDKLDVKCIAFYADCLHEIEKVKHGYRVALTFNLVLNYSESLSDNDNPRLKDAIKDYFCDENSEEPQKLVYFLNHQYSEHGLKWGLLKGTDRVNVSSLLNVAKRLQLVPHLALAEIQQSFAPNVEYYDYENSNTYLDDLKHCDFDLDSTEVTLSSWIDASNIKVNQGELEVADKEICWTKCLETFKPFKSTLEGLLGNGSASKELSYRRAAVVLWAESRQITMNFLLNRKNAIDELFQLIREPGNEIKVIDIVRKAGQYLYGKNFSVEQFISLSDVVLYVQDKNVAMGVLSHFSRSMVQVSTARTLAKLQNKYGGDWFMDFLDKLKKVKLHSHDINKVDDFLFVFLQNKGDLKIAELLLEKQSVAENDSLSDLDLGDPNRKFEKLGEIFKACEIISNVSMLHKFIENVKANYKKYPVLKLVDLFLNLQYEIGQDFYSHFGVLKVYLVHAINAELILAKDGADDWSLKISRVICHCNTCSDVISFLTSKTEVKSYPFHAKFKRHVFTKLRILQLPIDIIYVQRASADESFFSIEKKPSVHAQARARYETLLYYKEALSEHQF